MKPSSGILQGDTLAPLIFILCMDYILLQLRDEWGAIIEMPNEEDRTDKPSYVGRGTRSRPAMNLKRISNLAYADDVMLVSNTAENMQKQFELFQKLANSIGMTINLGAGKTEEIRLNVPDDVPPITTLSGDPGTMLGESWELDFKRRKKLAWGVIAEYSRVWKSRAKFDAKKGLFTALVEPILLYGAFTYPPGEAVDEKLHRVHSRLLRHCVGEGRPDSRKETHKPTEYLYYGEDKRRGKTWGSATLTLPAALNRQKLSALGHWCRDHFERGIKHPVIDILRFNPSASHYQRVGRPKKTVRDAFEDMLPQVRGHEKVTLRADVLVKSGLATDRHHWYDLSKERTMLKERRVMQPIFEARRDDPNRPTFGDTEYYNEMRILNDKENFTKRWLTRRTKEEPLGEDREDLL